MIFDVEFPLVLEEAESAQGIDDMICFVSTCHRVEVQDACRLRSRTLVYIRHHVPREADHRKAPMLKVMYGHEDEILLHQIQILHPAPHRVVHDVWFPIVVPPALRFAVVWIELLVEE